MSETGETPDASAAQPSEEEVRAQLEQEIRRLRVQDLLMESAVSVLNLSARRIAKEDERDLEQARVGIEAIRRLADLLDPEPQKQVREALAQVQMMFARTAGSAGPGEAGSGGAGETGPGDPGDPGRGSGGEEPPRPPRPGPGGRPSGLWTPPGTGR